MTTDTVPPPEATDNTTSETINTEPVASGMVADPRKDGIPLPLQTQNRDLVWGREARPLLIFEVAKHAIAAATTVEEVKDIRDKALGLAAYAREANDRQLEAEAVEIRARAARRLGEMIGAQKETVGLNTGTAGKGRPPSLGGSTDNPPKDDRPTLPSQGINKPLAHEARTLAKMPEEKFEEHVAAKVKATRTRSARKKMSHAEREERERERMERKRQRRAEQLAEHFPQAVEQVCRLTELLLHREDPCCEHGDGDDIGDLIIPPMPAETAAGLRPHVRAAIERLAKLDTALAEIERGGSEASLGRAQ